MKKKLILFLIFSSIVSWAQAPSISYLSYPGNSWSFNVNTNISPIPPPQNGGGAIPATMYGQVTTFAGASYPGDINGIGTAARFNTLSSLVVDAMGNLYVADQGNRKIKKISTIGEVSTFVGSGVTSSVDGLGTAASFLSPKSICIGEAGNFYVADGEGSNSSIRKISPIGLVTPQLPSGSFGSCLGASGVAYSPITFNQSVMISDTGRHKIIASSIQSGGAGIVAGNGTVGMGNGTGSLATFNFPKAIVYNSSGSLLYVADSGNNAIRKIDNQNLVTTVATGFNNPTGLAVSVGGTIYVADRNNNKIMQISPLGQVSTLAGTGIAGDTDGIGSVAKFYIPNGVAVDNAAGYLYVADYFKIRKICITGYSIYPSLPEGLNFDNLTGIISGTPTIAQPYTTYTVTAYNSYGSSHAFIMIEITPSLGINDFSKCNVKLYPNPTHSVLNLSVNDGICLDKITIVDITGKIAIEQTENLSKINVEQLSKGVYILTAYSGDQKFQEKFIKE